VKCDLKFSKHGLGVRLNICAVRGKFLPTGVSSTLLPQTIITGLSRNAAKDYRIPFEAYAQVHVDNTQRNSAMISRTFGAISLGPTGNIQGTYKFMSLLTGKLIKARSFTPLPMPEEVIKQVEEMATTNYLYQEGETDMHLDSMAASEEYQPSHQKDDVSLGSSEYSKISQNELKDITIEARAENDKDVDAIILEAILSDNNISTEVLQSQGVDDNADDKNVNLPWLQTLKEWRKMQMTNSKRTL
jgi:hypothetical protein